jgi:hypothetical protein
MLAPLEASLATDGGTETSEPLAEPCGARRTDTGPSCALTDERLRQRPESRSTGPIVQLRGTGDGTALARALARVLVRRVLIREEGIRVVSDCKIPPENV